jgi:tRNA/rRNA methyltransferase
VSRCTHFVLDFKFFFCSFETGLPRRWSPDRPAAKGRAMTGAGTNHSVAPLSGGPAIILVRPQLAVNIGMCARAMANFGLSDLRLVSPREGWPRTGAYRKGAYAAAAGAVHLLESARLFDSVAAAVSDLNLVYATTARERGQGKAILPPSQAMTATAAALTKGEKRGVLFGPERTGLDNDDVALADVIITFPVDPAYASLNLAQAVLLVAYEHHRAARGEAAPYPVTERSPPARREQMLAFFNFFEDQLDKNGFFRPEGKRPVMSRNLRNMFHRMQMTEQDVRTFWGAMVRLVEGPRAEKPGKARDKRENGDDEETATPSDQPQT